MTCGRLRGRTPLPVQWPSSHLPVQLLGGTQLLVVRLVLRELERFLAAERENSEHHERVVEQRVYAILQRLVEIDQYVSTEDDVEFAERSVRHEVVLREDDVPRQRCVEQRPVVLRGVVLRERFLAPRPQVVL